MTVLTRSLTDPADILGYFCGGAAALLVFALAANAHPEDGFIIPAVVGPGWVTLSATTVLVSFLPYVLAVCLAGPARLALLTNAVALGVAVGMATLPLVFFLSLSLTGGNESISQALVSAIRFTWPLYAGAGATGGLIWWAVRWSTPLAPMRRILSSGSGFVQGSRAAIGGMFLLLMSGWMASHVASSAGQSRVPEGAFVLRNEVPVNGIPSRIVWSRDGQAWAALSSIDSWLAICGANGENLRELRLRHVGAGAAPVFANGGRHLVIPGTLDGQARYALSAIDALTGETVFAIRDPAPTSAGDPGMAISLASSADGDTLALAFNAVRPGQPVSIFTTSNWTRRTAFQPVANVDAIALSPDGRLLLTVMSGAITVVDAKDGQVIRTIKVTHRPSAIAVSPDGTMVAVLDEAAVRLLRLEDGEALSVHPIIGRTSQDVAWDPGQRYIAFVDSANILRFWSPGRTGGVERRFELRSPVGGIAISPDGTRVAVGNGNVISFFGVNDPGGDIIH